MGNLEVTTRVGNFESTVYIDPKRSPYWHVELARDGVRAVMLRFEHDGARWTCVGAEVGPSEVSDTPYAEVTPDLLRQLAADWPRYLALAEAVIEWDHEATAKATSELRRERTNRSLPASFYKAIAAEYRALHKRSQRPTAGIAHAHGVKRATASRWVRRARDLGFLGEALPRRAGEAEQ